MKKKRIKPYILDGAIGTELIRRSVNLPLPLWSGDANLTHPETVIQIHQDYVNAGADILTTNTFRTTPRTYLKSGFSDTDSTKRALKSLNAAVSLARRAARKEYTIIAGSIAPLEDCYSPELFPGYTTAENEFVQLSEWLENAGVDVLLFETMGCLQEIKAAISASSTINIPRWVSLILKNKDHLLDGSDLKNTIKYLAKNNIDIILINCTLISILDHALKVLNEMWSGSWGVYPNTGVSMPSKDGHITEMVSDNEFSSAIKGYADMGASVVGACCGSTPKTIQLIQNTLENESI